MTDYYKYAYGADGKLKADYDLDDAGHPIPKQQARRIQAGKFGIATTELTMNPPLPPIPQSAYPAPVSPVAVALDPFAQFGIYKTEPDTTVPAHKFLEDANKVMKQRAQLRDKPEGERSMETIVKAFNALTGKTLTEAEGWEFMILLKMVRGRQGSFNEDDYTDMAAYSGLLGECESKSRK